MNDKRKLLLLKGVRNNGVVTWNMATTLYSSDNAAHNALAGLEFQGYIKNVGFGRFKVVKVPRSVKERV